MKFENEDIQNLYEDYMEMFVEEGIHTTAFQSYVEALADSITPTEYTDIVNDFAMTLYDVDVDPLLAVNFANEFSYHSGSGFPMVRFTEDYLEATNLGDEAWEENALPIPLAKPEEKRIVLRGNRKVMKEVKDSLRKLEDLIDELLDDRESLLEAISEISEEE